MKMDTEMSPNDASATHFEHCWAKTTEDKQKGMPVHEHCRIVGCVAKELINRLPGTVVRVLPEYSVAIAAFHDVGKVSPGFQKKIAPHHAAKAFPDLADKSFAGLETSHAKIGQAAVNQLLDERFYVPPTAAVVGAHHGFWQDVGIHTDIVGKYGGKAWSKERRRLLDTLTAEFGPIANAELSFPVQSALAGFVTVADWIGSDEEFFPSIGLPAGTDLSSLVRKALWECGWRVPQLRPGLSFEEVFCGKKPYPIQEEFIEVVTSTGLYILEAPMGCGKTEAALYAAYKLMTQGHNLGLYFGLPTRLTSDKIHERVEPFLDRICTDKTHARLAHGLAWLKEFEHGGKGFESYGRYDNKREKFDNKPEEDEPKSSWFNPRKRALLWPFAVGTIDQAILSVVRTKHHFVRAFGLAGKVVILDEVHSYDMYTSSLIETLVQQLLELGCTVIVLSATLTGERRNRLIGPSFPPAGTEAYPLITCKTASGIASVGGTAGPNREYAVSMADMDANVVAEQAVEKACQGYCVLCIANTVKHAQVWYDAVCAAMPQGAFDVGLLHAKFPVFRREELESEWLNRLGKDSRTRPNGCVLVATQVVEQSVDIDADLLITDLAPTDMLLQRMGRLWRHEATVRPPACTPWTRIICGNVAAALNRDELLAALGGKSCFVYQPYALWRTWRVWNRISCVSLPSDIRGLIEAIYAGGTGDEPVHVRELREKLERDRSKLEKLAGSSLAGVRLPPQDDEDVMTRYSDRPMQDVLLIRSVEDHGRTAILELLDGEAPLRLEADRRNFYATKRLHRQLISVPKYVFKQLGMPAMPLWLRMHFHAPTPIWELSDDLAQLIMSGQETGYTYDKWRGLRRLHAPKAEPQPLDEFEGYDPFEGEEG